MSMHEIEDLVECSVQVLAAEPEVENARDLCYSLYRMQDQFDCGYTTLRVAQELERLGYLRRLPPERLPEPERGEALRLGRQGGFIGEPPETYFDAQEGLACVTAGSPLWEKLGLDGASAPVREVPVPELARQIATLALKQGDETAATVLGLWYALYPLLSWLDPEEDDEETLASVREIRDLLATPQALAAAAGWRLLPTANELGECDSTEELWLAPYIELLILSELQKENLREACDLAARLPEEGRYYRALASLAFYQTQAETPSEPFDGLLTLEETRQTFASLIGRLPEEDHVCQLSVAVCSALLRDYPSLFEALGKAMAPAMEKQKAAGDGWSRRFGEAEAAVAFYRTLAGFIPDGEAGKADILRSRAEGIPTLREARETLESLLEGNPQQEWQCRLNLGVCLMLEGDRDGARRELELAERLRPGDENVREALDALDA